MTVQEKKQYVLNAMHAMSGDDLERANIAFSGLTEKQLDSQWGRSGRTCREVWDGYRLQRARWKEAYEWLQELLKARGQ